MSNFKFLDFDSELFGYNIFSITLNNNDFLPAVSYCKEARAKGAKLIYIISSKELPVALEPEKKLVDRKVTYEICLGKKNNSSYSGEIKEYTLKKASKALLNLSLDAGAYSRFNKDSNFKDKEYIKLYNLWIEKSVSKDIADKVLIYLAGQNIAGFITLKVCEQRLGNIGLLSVNEAFRGQGIGQKLIKHALKDFFENGCRKVEVVTQLENQPACKLYEKCGFSQVDIKYIYHLWVD